MPLKFVLTDDDIDERDLFTEAVISTDPTIICETWSKTREMLKQLERPGYIKPDLLFLDINIPEMNGWECLKVIKNSSTLKDIPVLMYSTSSHQREREIASDLGAIGLVTKPTNFDQLKNLLSIICEHIQSKNYAGISALK